MLYYGCTDAMVSDTMEALFAPLHTHLKRPHLLTYGILPSSDRRLACTAFIDVFRRRQSRHSVLLAWLHAQLGVPGVRGQQRRLERVVVQKKKTT